MSIKPKCYNCQHILYMQHSCLRIVHRQHIICGIDKNIVFGIFTVISNVHISKMSWGAGQQKFGEVE